LWRLKELFSHKKTNEVFVWPQGHMKTSLVSLSFFSPMPLGLFVASGTPVAYLLVQRYNKKEKVIM